MGPATRSDARNLVRLDLVRPQAIRPDAGGVDDVGGPNLKLLTRVRLTTTHTDRPPVVLEQINDLGAVDHHGTKALSLTEDGQHQPHIVGLAVVEQVGGARLLRGERGDQVDHLVSADRPVAIGRPVVLDLLPGRALPPATSDAGARHHVVQVQTDPDL